MGFCVPLSIRWPFRPVMPYWLIGHILPLGHFVIAGAPPHRRRACFGRGAPPIPASARRSRDHSAFRRRPKRGIPAVLAPPMHIRISRSFCHPVLCIPRSVAFLRQPTSFPLLPSLGRPAVRASFRLSCRQVLSSRSVTSLRRLEQIPLSANFCEKNRLQASNRAPYSGSSRAVASLGRASRGRTRPTTRQQEHERHTRQRNSASTAASSSRPCPRWARGSPDNNEPKDGPRPACARSGIRRHAWTFGSARPRR